jgi:hypothetical protein
VRPGTGYADFLAVEEEGRLVINKIKLARNAEARPAVVAQVLAYASELQRLSLETAERHGPEGDLRSLNRNAWAAIHVVIRLGFPRCVLTYRESDH